MGGKGKSSGEKDRLVQRPWGTRELEVPSKEKRADVGGQAAMAEAGKDSMMQNLRARASSVDSAQRRWATTGVEAGAPQDLTYIQQPKTPA